MTPSFQLSLATSSEALPQPLTCNRNRQRPYPASATAVASALSSLRAECHTNGLLFRCPRWRRGSGAKRDAVGHLMQPLFIFKLCSDVHPIIQLPTIVAATL